MFYMIGLSYLFAIMYPAPSLAVIIKNSLGYSSKIGFSTALGTVTEIAEQVLYTLAGLIFLQESPYL